MVNDSDAKSNLVTSIITLINNKEQLIELKENILKTGNKNADKKIAGEIFKTLNN